MVYLDTSVVVAYYVPEPLSTRVQAIYDALTAPAISELVELEFFAAVSLRLRVGDLERAQVEQIVRLFLRHLQGGWYTRVQLHAGHYRRAQGFIARFELPLKAPDALHLAVSAAEGQQIITADRQLARNAEALELEVELVRPS